MDLRWTLTEFYSQYKRALEELEVLEVRWINTRLDRYRKIIAAAIEAEAKGNFAHQGSPDFVNAFSEAFDIIQIANLDRSLLDDSETHRKLISISGGPDVMNTDAHDSARDHALEFVIAASLHEKGQFGGFSRTNGDLLLADDQRPVECKRLSSMSSLENRLRKARKQIVAQVQAGRAPGLICIDVTNPGRHKFGLILESKDALLNTTSDSHLNAFVAQSLTEIDPDGAVKCDEVLGIVFRYVGYGYAGEKNNIRVAPSYQLVCPHDEGSDLADAFFKASNCFGSGPIVPATGLDLEEGIRIYSSVSRKLARD